VLVILAAAFIIVGTRPEISSPGHAVMPGMGMMMTQTPIRTTPSPAPTPTPVSASPIIGQNMIPEAGPISAEGFYTYYQDGAVASQRWQAYADAIREVGQKGYRIGEMSDLINGVNKNADVLYAFEKRDVPIKQFISKYDLWVAVGAPAITGQAVGIFDGAAEPNCIGKGVSFLSPDGWSVFWEPKPGLSKDERQKAIDARRDWIISECIDRCEGGTWYCEEHESNNPVCGAEPIFYNPWWEPQGKYRQGCHCKCREQCALCSVQGEKEYTLGCSPGVPSPIGPGKGVRCQYQGGALSSCGMVNC
jgi:hypothetical protein